MSEIINLRTRRKQTARDSARDQASANAARHGESKAARNLQAARAEKTARDHEAHRRDGKDGPQPGD